MRPPCRRLRCSAALAPALLQPPAAVAVALAASCQVGELLTPLTTTDSSWSFRVRMHAFVGQVQFGLLQCRIHSPTAAATSIKDFERRAWPVRPRWCLCRGASVTCADKCTSASSCARASPRLMNGHPMHRRPTRRCTCDPPLSWAAMIGCWPLWGMRRASSRDPPPPGPQREKKIQRGCGGRR